jgi:putative aldouronate transport system substrate-binding protein
MRRVMVLAALLVVLPVAALLASGSTDSGAAAGGKETYTWVRYVDGPVDEPSYAQEKFQARYPNVTIKIVGLQRPTFYEQLNAKLAGGEKFDMIHEWSNDWVRAHVEQGVIAEVPYEWLKKYTPKFFQVQKTFGREVFQASYVDGKNYGVPTVGESQTFPFTDGIRLDWLRNVGLSDKLPDIMSIAELDEIYKRFTRNDPDKNGKDDTYGYSMRAKDSLLNMFCVLLGAYNVAPGAWNKLPDGTVTYGLLLDNFRTLLRQVNTWYKAGYMDPEFVTQAWAELRERWNNGKIGVIHMSTWYRLIPGGENWEQPKAINPNADIGMLPPVKGPSGSYGYFGWGKATGTLAFGAHLAKEPAKIQKQLAIIDELTTDKQWYIDSNWGQEGVHWQRNPKTGAFEFIPPYNETQKRGPIGMYFWSTFSGSWDVSAQSYGTQTAIWTKYATNRTFAPETSFTYLIKTSADANKQIAAATPIWSAWIVKFITGEKSLDTDWEQYKKEVLAAGMDKVIPEANNLWKNVDSILATIDAGIK